MNWNSIRLALPLLLAVACVKEIPRQTDSGQESGTLTVCLPETGTKTALGAKADGKYPVLWKEGDCLSLNGYPSLPLSLQDAGSSSAGFVFRGGLAAPYNLLYPVSGEADLVVFPASQMHVEGGFDPAAVPMWGTSNSYTSVSLRHFFSLVRISIKTETARVLKSITLTALGGEPISGSFRAGTDGNGAFDGSLQVENGRPSVLYSFGDEGISLAAGQTAVAYISIPIGNYSAGFKAVVQSSEREYRQLRFFSDGRKVAPGKVLEFPDKDFDECSVIWEYFVSATGNGDGLSDETPMSISDLMALLSNPDGTKLKDATIHFVAGTHAITSPIVLPGKETYNSPLSYTITGDNQAVLSGGGSSQIFLVTEDNSHVTIKEVELTNGSSTESGGLVSIQNNSPLFEHCNFTNSVNTTTGGAVRISGEGKGNGLFRDCRFTGNSANSGGGAVVITNPRTKGLFSGCHFSGNSSSSTSGVGGAIYSTNGTLTLDNCTVDGNKASAGGAFYVTAGTVHINGGRISNNTADTQGSAFCCKDGQKPVFYVNGCSFVDNNAAQNGYVIYLNTSTAPNFATLCMNNCTVYNTKPMETSNASAVCNKGKSLVLNSTFVASTTRWGTWALGCHKNFEDHYGCLLLNSIFVNTASGKTAIYQTGANYYAIAKHCIASAVTSNSQFTQNEVLLESPDLDWNGSLFSWDGRTTLSQWRRQDIETELSGSTYALAAGFLDWLKGLKFNIDGNEYDALDVDQTGHLRSTYSWAGAYQK